MQSNWISQATKLAYQQITPEQFPMSRFRLSRLLGFRREPTIMERIFSSLDFGESGSSVVTLLVLGALVYVSMELKKWAATSTNPTSFLEDYDLKYFKLREPQKEADRPPCFPPRNQRCSSQRKRSKSRPKDHGPRDFNHFL